MLPASEGSQPNVINTQAFQWCFKNSVEHHKVVVLLLTGHGASATCLKYSGGLHNRAALSIRYPGGVQLWTTVPFSGTAEEAQRRQSCSVTALTAAFMGKTYRHPQQEGHTVQSQIMT